jgi:hypothetical protein
LVKVFSSGQLFSYPLEHNFNDITLYPENVVNVNNTSGEFITHEDNRYLLIDLGDTYELTMITLYCKDPTQGILFNGLTIRIITDDYDPHINYSEEIGTVVSEIVLKDDNKPFRKIYTQANVANNRKDYTIGVIPYTDKCDNDIGCYKSGSDKRLFNRYYYTIDNKCYKVINPNATYFNLKNLIDNPARDPFLYFRSCRLDYDTMHNYYRAYYVRLQSGRNDVAMMIGVFRIFNDREFLINNNPIVNPFDINQADNYLKFHDDSVTKITATPNGFYPIVEMFINGDIVKRIEVIPSTNDTNKSMGTPTIYLLGKDRQTILHKQLLDNIYI